MEFRKAARTWALEMMVIDSGAVMEQVHGDLRQIAPDRAVLHPRYRVPKRDAYRAVALDRPSNASAGATSTLRLCEPQHLSPKFHVEFVEVPQAIEATQQANARGSTFGPWSALPVESCRHYAELPTS